MFGDLSVLGLLEPKRVPKFTKVMLKHGNMGQHQGIFLKWNRKNVNCSTFQLGDFLVSVVILAAAALQIKNKGYNNLIRFFCA